MHHLEGGGALTGPAKFLPWWNSDCQELCKPEISMYVGRQTLTLIRMWNLPVTTYKVTLAMLGSEFVLKGLSPCYRWQLLLCYASPLFILKTRLSDCLSNLCIKILAGCSLWVFFTCCGFEGKLPGCPCYRVCSTFGSHQKMSWKYFVLWNWEENGLASVNQICLVSLILGLSRFMESCLYFLKCYTHCYKPLFSFWNLEES